MTKKSVESGAAADGSKPFEELLAVVESKLRSLEGGELTLDDSLRAYEEGVRALRGCYEHLRVAEGRIEILTKRGEEPEAADFDPETGQAKGKPRKARRAERSEENEKPAKPSGDGGGSDLF